MSLLDLAFQDGQHDALSRFKLAEPRVGPVAPSVRKSTVLSGKPAPVQSLQPAPPPTSPQTIGQVSSVQEQNKSLLEPLKKLSELLCTTCRKPKHYGNCGRPTKVKPEGVPIKAADFNYELTPDNATSDKPPHHMGYHADVAPPPTPQAAQGFANAFARFDTAGDAARVTDSYTNTVVP